MWLVTPMHPKAAVVRRKAARRKERGQRKKGKILTRNLSERARYEAYPSRDDKPFDRATADKVALHILSARLPDPPHDLGADP